MMKKFLFKVLLLLVLMFLVDKGVGVLFPVIQKYDVEAGEDSKYKHISGGCPEEVLIFGSSRAYRHYNSRIITDSLGLSCYNCGQSSMGMIHNYALLSMTLERNTPKMIIYDINPYLDFLESKNTNYMYLKGLKPYRHRQGVQEVMNDVGRHEQVKTMVNLYAYNNQHVILNWLNHRLGRKDQNDMPMYNGFTVTLKTFDTKKVEKVDTREYMWGRKPDTLKEKYLHKFIEASKGTQLIFCISPRWYGLNSWQVEYVKNICTKYQIPLIDFSNAPKYVHHDNYFQDGTHLNARGADEFTRDLIVELKERGLVDDSHFDN